jgi:hypothetical protein
LKGSEFIKKVKRYAAAKKQQVKFDEKHGKGSHGRLFLGDAFTTLKDLKTEIGKGLFRSMCKDLGINPKDLE